MDNNPTDPNTNPPGTSSFNPSPDLAPPAGITQPQQDQIIADVPELPHSQMTQPITSPLTSPWESQPKTQTPVTAGMTPTATDIQTPLPESPWSQPTATPADVPKAPTAPPVENPFLQSQPGGNISIPQTSFDQPAGSPLPPLGSAIPNPTSSTAPDPLNTAFNPTATPPENPFAQPQANQTPPPSPVSPWESSPEQTGTPPAQAADSTNGTGFIAMPPENSGMTQAQPGEITTNPTMIDNVAPSNSSSGTLDLSSLQSSSPTEPNQQPPQQGMPAQPSSQPPPQNPPVENAPTDLSHLIAGDETGAPQPMGNVYTPPVAADQTPGVGVPQTPATEGGSTSPPEKHLNLTKVLLVAGIPIILIVAALSAYLILGVGRAAPEDTSLPVEETQAPLTNPPQQITVPSPAIIPEPGSGTTLPTSSAGPELTGSSPSPAATTGSSAMDRLRARQSPSPAATGSPSASANPDGGESLPQ